MSDECRFDMDARCVVHGGASVAPIICTHAAAALQARYQVAVRALSRLGLVEHAGTWITREEADRISKDGP